MNLTVFNSGNRYLMFALCTITGYGLFTNGTTLYANASTCNFQKEPFNPPICVDIKLPDGYSKDELSIDN